MHRGREPLEETQVLPEGGSQASEEGFLFQRNIPAE